MENLGIVAYAGIVAVCYVVGMIVNNTKLSDKWTQVFCMVSGAAVAIAAFYTKVPIGAENWLDAVGVGIVSGLAATGVYELGKNIKKNS